MIICEPECVTIKRRGAEHVAKLLTGKNLEEQLFFWQQRTEQLLAKQTKVKSHPSKKPKQTG